MTDFGGSKGAFLCMGRVLCYLRDDKPTIPFPAHWDLPGGGRDGVESPEACLLRELYEEFGLTLSEGRLIWKRAYPWTHKPHETVWFFGAHLTQAEVDAVRFGDEGQYWRMMPIADFLAHDRAVQDLKLRLRAWVDAQPLGKVGL